MPAKVSLPPFLSNAARTMRPLFILTLVAVVAFASWLYNAQAAAASTTTSSAITPALKLAMGTLDLEGTDQAVDAASAAKLLPLWQLLAQLQSSGYAAPQEITAVIDEIRLNMTSSQIKAIDAMSINHAELASASGNAGSSAAAAKTTGTQVAAAGGDLMLGGGLSGGGMPMDGGGPMPSGSTQSTSSTKASSSTATPAVIKQVIQLLESKVQG